MAKDGDPGAFGVDLGGRVAVVTGASYGVGKGVAEELAASGARTYATGRTVARTAFDADCIAVPCDHTDDAAVESLFARIAADEERLDILVNAAWGGYENMVQDGEFTWDLPFWEQPLRRWDAMFDAGVRAAFAASRLAARPMLQRRSGLIVNLSYWSARKHMANVPYGVSKAATDKMTSDMAHELRDHGVAVLSLYPGLVRTEKVLQAADALDLSNSESPRFVGRAVAALAGDPAVKDRSGSVVLAAECARRYGFEDVDGGRPEPLTLETA